MAFVLFSMVLALLGAALTYLGVTRQRRDEFSRPALAVYVAASASFALAWASGACYLRPATALMLTLATTMLGLTASPFAGAALASSRTTREAAR